MRILGVIPARFASSRFPGKPLVQINGKSMIRRVYEQSIQSTSLTDVIVATDDESIAEEIRSFGGKVAITSHDHVSGTDRCAEVALQHPQFDAVINIQGDEPFIDPAQIDLLASCFINPEVQIATLIKKIATEEELFNLNMPKVLIDTQLRAIYFSRHTLPYNRNLERSSWLEAHTYYKHIGIYGYRSDVLQEITKLAPSSLELSESLEQLRWIEHGYRVQTKITDIETIAIDTPEDLQRVISSL